LYWEVAKIQARDTNGRGEGVQNTNIVFFSAANAICMMEYCSGWLHAPDITYTVLACDIFQHFMEDVIRHIFHSL
jgi:hypothetical protein